VPDVEASLCGPGCGAPLFLHVAGAMALFGGIASVAILSWAAASPTEHAPLLRRLALNTTLLVVWPAYVLMRVSAQWVLDREGLDTSTPGWVDVGFVVADAGVVVLLVVTLLAWLSRRRPRVTPWLAGLVSLYGLALAVAWFAMAAKPGS
jgi:hypothetical protein